LLNPKITKNLVTYSVYFGFVNLQAVGAWQPPKFVGDAKLFVYYCRLFEERAKGTNLRLPREFDNYPKSPFWGKLLLLPHVRIIP
jgi:hypothetical protein